MKSLLALDCSTSRGSVAVGRRALHEPPTVGWSKEFPAGRGCGGQLFAALQEALEAMAATHNACAAALEGILVGLGPGSYSGVRQAIAAAIGLSASTGAWLRGVPSPIALYSAKAFQVIGDARRGTYYYTLVRDGSCARGPMLVEDEALLKTLLAGQPGVPICAVEAPFPGDVLPDAKVCFPDAARLLTWAHEGLDAIAPPLEPIYLRPVSITLPKSVSPLAT